VSLAVVLAGAYLAYASTGAFPGLQGRYLFGTLGALLSAAALTATLVTRRALPGLVRRLPAVTLALALASGAYAALHVLRAVYQPWDETLRDALVRWDAWSLLTRPELAAVVLAPAVAGAVALVLLGRAGRTVDPAEVACLTAPPSGRPPRPGEPVPAAPAHRAR
jgi:hypothetical protein